MNDPVAYWMWVGVLSVCFLVAWVIWVYKWWPIPWAIVAAGVALAACSRFHS